MRAVAEAAGVSLGNAYYYFASKAHLLHGFYAQSHADHLAAARPVLARERDFHARLRGVLLAKLDTSEPYHRFAQLLFGAAADPESPLEPVPRDVGRRAPPGRRVDGGRARGRQGEGPRGPHRPPARAPLDLRDGDHPLLGPRRLARPRALPRPRGPHDRAGGAPREAREQPALAPLRKAIVRTLDDVARDPSAAAASVAAAGDDGDDDDDALPAARDREARTAPSHGPVTKGPRDTGAGHRASRTGVRPRRAARRPQRSHAGRPVRDAGSAARGPHGA